MWGSRTVNRYRTLSRSYKQRSIVIPTEGHRAHNLPQGKAQCFWPLSYLNKQIWGRAGTRLLSGRGRSGTSPIKQGPSRKEWTDAPRLCRRTSTPASAGRSSTRGARPAAARGRARCPRRGPREHGATAPETGTSRCHLDKSLSERPVWGGSPVLPLSGFLHGCHWRRTAQKCITFKQYPAFLLICFSCPVENFSFLFNFRDTVGKRQTAFSTKHLLIFLLCFCRFFWEAGTKERGAFYLETQSLLVGLSGVVTNNFSAQHCPVSWSNRPQTVPDSVAAPVPLSLPGTRGLGHLPSTSGWCPKLGTCHRYFSFLKISNSRKKNKSRLLPGASSPADVFFLVLLQCSSELCCMNTYI